MWKKASNVHNTHTQIPWFVFLSFFFCSAHTHLSPDPNNIWSSQPRIPAPLGPKLQLWPCWILNSLCWIEDQTCIPEFPWYHGAHCATAETPQIPRNKIKSTDFWRLFGRWEEQIRWAWLGYFLAALMAWDISWARVCRKQMCYRGNAGFLTLRHKGIPGLASKSKKINHLQPKSKRSRGRLTSFIFQRWSQGSPIPYEPWKHCHFS